MNRNTKPANTFAGTVPTKIHGQREVAHYTILKKYGIIRTIDMAELRRYKLNELLARGNRRVGEDEYLEFGDPSKLKVFAANPFRHDEDVITRYALLADGEVAGGEYTYPVEIMADGQIVRVSSGSETFVKEKFRKQAIGLEFLASEGDIAESSTVSIGCGIAQRYARIHKMFGYRIFPMYRHIALFKSRAVVEMRLRGSLGKLVSSLANLALGCWWQLERAMVSFRMRGLCVRELASSDDAGLKSVSDFISFDPHRFREHHSVEWFRWLLTSALHPEGPARLFALERKGKIVAFFMTKRKFYEQASSRGFRNVMLGSVIEWGMGADDEIREADLVTFAAFHLRKSEVDAVEVVTADSAISRALKWRIMIQVGESNLGVRVGGKSELAKFSGWDDPGNWRLRPAMCDNGL